MPVVRETVVVNAPLEITFDVSNRIELWPDMMAEYKGAKILSREGRKIWFSLRDNEGHEWSSWRMLYRPDFTYAERHEPKAPFKFMHITWTYTALGDSQTEMTWDMSFELPDDKKSQEAQWVEGMSAHTRSNQAAMKAYIEAHASE